MSRMTRKIWQRLFVLVIAMALSGSPGSGAVAGENTFDAVFVDAGGLETAVSHVVFYWEEQLSETQLALHELTHIPAKRGTVPIQIHFEKIKQVEFKNSADRDEPILSVTLKSGKSADFSLQIPGSFKGRTDFGEMIAGPTHLRKILFK